METVDYNAFLREQMENDEFKREYEKLEEEFTLARDAVPEVHVRAREEHTGRN